MNDSNYRMRPEGISDGEALPAWKVSTGRRAASNTSEPAATFRGFLPNRDHQETDVSPRKRQAHDRKGHRPRQAALRNARRSTSISHPGDSVARSPSANDHEISPPREESAGDHE